VIADFEAYPDWTGSVKSATVIEEDEYGWAYQVRFTLDAGAIRDTYVLEYDWDIADDGSGTMSWSLVEGNVLKAMDGSYILSSVNAGCAVTYQLGVELRVPMLGVLRRKAEKVIIDTALHELKKRAEG
jgi:hypothetical protein